MGAMLMTKQKHLKRRVRARMKKTGESYSSARRHVLSQVATDDSMMHWPGNNPATNALRVLLANHGQERFSEAMTLGIAGGLGAGVFTFHYEKEDFVSFFIAGRHRWEDDRAFLQHALERMGYQANVFETGGAETAQKQLAEQTLPAIIWADAGSLPYRAMPSQWSGGGYHVIVVYEFEPGKGALVGDLADRPIRMPVEALASARGRIKKDKHRMLTLGRRQRDPDLAQMIGEGIKACHRGLEAGRANFTLKAFESLSSRMHGSQAKDSWEKLFPPGRHLWTALTALYDFVEHYGTGGGLLRPLYAAFLREAGDTLGDQRYLEAAELYSGLGNSWSELAEVALAEEQPIFREAKRLLALKEELLMSEGSEAESKIRQAWDDFDRLTVQAGEDFPLQDSEAEALRAELKGGLDKILEKEQQGVRLLKELAGDS